jgi:hypothetical protein
MKTKSKKSKVTNELTDDLEYNPDTDTNLEVIQYINHDIHPVRDGKSINAFLVISESEVSAVVPDYFSGWENTNREEFLKLLYKAGCDTRYEIEIQDNLKHRNRMNQVVICRRWICYERTDDAWIESGYASRDAIHKASGNKLLRDLNRYTHAPL